MRINAISLMSFNGKQQVAKRAAKAAVSMAAVGIGAASISKLNADEFKKQHGFTMPTDEKDVIIAHDDDGSGWNPCDDCVDASCDESYKD